MSPPPHIVTLDLVAPQKHPNFDKEVLEPLRKAQAEKAAEDARKVEEARLAQEAADLALRESAQSAQGAEPGQVWTSSTVRVTVSNGNNYTPGQCTWYVASRRSVPLSMGNATNWEYGLLNAGWHITAPVPGAIGVSHAGYAGHVVIVESVSGGVVTISEMNGAGGPYSTDTRQASAGEFVYLN